MPCSSIANKAIGQVCRPAEKKRLEKKLLNLNKNGIDYCKLETCTMSCSFFSSHFFNRMANLSSPLVHQATGINLIRTANRQKFFVFYIYAN